ncbi:hypothetical protein, partial [Acinetobacter baumannii]|uniref:hypothetical protein n=2 Tax=Gammaproteobacteria TaxID=1236 RepID=UPI0037C68CAB
FSLREANVAKPEIVSRPSRTFSFSMAISQFGSLPQSNGKVNVSFGAGEALGGAGSEDNHAATALTSSSVKCPATICMQSGAVAVRVP